MAHSSKEVQQSREIARLARTYARNRSLGVVLSLLIFILLFAGMSIFSYLGGITYREGNFLLFGVCMAALVPLCAAIVYMSVPKWGGRRLEEFANRLYREGQVSVSIPHQKERQPFAVVLGITFGCCVLGTVLLGFLGYMPLKYAQPVSALYVIPFLVGLWFLMRPEASLISLLWPILYGLHAMLIVAGAPIVFSEQWEALNIGLPIVGYGILSALIGHAYSRYALHKLRRIAKDGRASEAQGPLPQ